MWYLLVCIPVAIWVYIDSRRRLFEPGKWWALASALLGPITAPVYIAIRPLRKGERREGGLPWNILKNFALFWTLTLFVAAIAGLVNASQVIDETTNEYEQAGAVVGTGLGLAAIFAIWFFPMVGAIMLGVFLKKSTEVEEGPTGPLANAAELHYGLKDFMLDAKKTSLHAVEKAKTIANDLKAKQQARPTKEPPPKHEE